MISKLIEKDKEYIYNTSKDNFQNIIKDKKIILYGAGAIGTAIINSGFEIYAIIDKKFKKGDCYLNISCYNPIDFKLFEDENKYIVLLAIRNKKYHKEIIKCLKEIGFNNIIIAIDYYESQTPFIHHEIQKEGFNYFLKNKNNILKAIKLFKDELSLNIFMTFMQTHLERKLVIIPFDKADNQYFPEDIKLNKGYFRFINCGSYTGDTIKQLNKKIGKIDSLVCFEPDLQTYKQLIKYLSKNKENISENIITFPCGVYNTETILNFMSGATTSSAISDNGETSIQCVSLDNVLLNFKPTFINMDIEGAELEALKGAKKTIKKYKPDLAICVYHIPNHIWEIPLYLNSLKLGYKFYLRNYTGFIYETILYAIEDKN